VDSRDEAPQYALSLVVRVERDSPPARTDALEGAARAVLWFLDDPRVTAPDGEWAGAVDAWTDGRIRKVVRRARGAGWERASALPGITITQGSAEIRVYPPVPVDEWPSDLARLQVAGTELEDPAPPPPVPDGTPILWINPGLTMTAGKAMAQVGHAAQLAWMRLGATDRKAWRDRDFDLAVRPAQPERWAALVASGLPIVQDGGFTEVAPGSCTVVADLPALRLPAR
jgi:peptidyl-tRNA hydrolase